MPNLTDGQWMINGVLFGRNTRLPISSLDLTGYDVATSDFQLARSDEMRFSRDSLKPGTLTFTVAAVDNFLLPTMGSLTDRTAPIEGLVSMDTLMEQFSWAWNSKGTRTQFGVADCLYYGSRGQVLQVYGRARKFASNARSQLAQFRTATAEFQRVDTSCYSDTEFVQEVMPSSPLAYTANLVRSGGLADTWLQMFVYGPATNINIMIQGVGTIQIGDSGSPYTLASGKVLEINSYPWTRRVIDSDGLNVAPMLIGDSVYLDQMFIPANATTQVGFSASSTSGATKMEFLWREAYSVL